jgi:hypothetical protein
MEKVPVRIPLQKYAGTPLQKKDDSTSTLTEKCAGKHFVTEKVPVRIPL